MSNYSSTSNNERLTRKGYRNELIATLSEEQKELLLLNNTLDSEVSIKASGMTQSQYESLTEKRKAARNRKSGRNLNKLLNKYPSVQALDFWDSMPNEEKLKLLAYLDSIVKGSELDAAGEPKQEEIVMTPFRQEEYTGISDSELDTDI